MLLLGEASHPLCDSKEVFIPCVIQGRCFHPLWISREVSSSLVCFKRGVF